MKINVHVCAILYELDSRTSKISLMHNFTPLGVGETRRYKNITVCILLQEPLLHTSEITFIHNFTTTGLGEIQQYMKINVHVCAILRGHN